MEYKLLYNLGLLDIYVDYNMNTYQMLMAPVKEFMKKHPNATKEELVKVMMITLNEFQKMMEMNIRKKHQPTDEQM